MSTDKIGTIIITQYSLTGESSPKEGGKIIGLGTCRESEHVQVTAIPTKDHWFDHWEGDINGEENPTTITMDHDKYIIAFFGVDMTIIYSLMGKTIPPEGGNIVGLGDYSGSTTVQVQAKAEKDYAFDHWEGDVSGNENPTTIIMDCDKNIVGIFRQYLQPNDKKYKLGIKFNTNINRDIRKEK